MDVSILCGGEGTRLRPLTYAVPKPLLPLGSKPILEVNISRMRDQGFKTFYLMVNYMAENIRSYFGTGKALGVKIEYIEEKTKRGTAGPLSELKDIVKEPFITLNADLWTNLDYSKLMKFHKKNKADLTVAVKKFERKVAYGVIELDEEKRIVEIREKPDVSFLINSGIYVVSPNLLEIIPPEGEYPMTELIESARESGFNVLGYQFTESWRDIGRLDDYLKAINDLENGKVGDTEGVFM